MNKAWMWVVMVGSIGAVGCGNNPVREVESELEGTIVAVCESCPSAFGEASTDACIARTPVLFLPETWDCIEANYTSEQDPFWDCYRDAYDRFDACVRPLLTPCPTEAGIELCRGELDMARDACPAFPAGVAGCFEE